MDKNNTVKDLFIMRIMVCDDNELFLSAFKQKIEDYCAKKDWECQIVVFSDPKKILNESIKDVEIVFLDIDMPNRNGLDIARELRSQSEDLIIVFVTGFLEYAPKGYTVGAFRYLLKTDIDNSLINCLDDIWEKLYVKQEAIAFLTEEQETINIQLKNIIYIEGTARRYVRVHLTSEMTPVIECRGSLVDYTNELYEKGFMRIQKSFIVNLIHVKDIRSYVAYLDNGETLKVSRNDYKSVMNRFLIWTGDQI